MMWPPMIVLEGADLDVSIWPSSINVCTPYPWQCAFVELDV